MKTAFFVFIGIITSRNCFGRWLLFSLKLANRRQIERIFSKSNPHDLVFKSNDEQSHTFES